MRGIRKPIKSKDTRERHGYTGTPTYISWIEMRKRCYDPSVIRYPKYGGRGIRVCESWKESFSAFLSDMGEKPSRQHSLDRIDVNGDYGPSNCRWATMSEQMDNKTTTIYLTAFGKTQSLMSWSRETGIPGRIIRQRLTRDGLNPEQALSTMREPGSGRHDEKLYG